MADERRDNTFMGALHFWKLNFCDTNSHALVLHGRTRAKGWLILALVSHVFFIGCIVCFFGLWVGRKTFRVCSKTSIYLCGICWENYSKFFWSVMEWRVEEYRINVTQSLMWDIIKKLHLLAKQYWSTGIQTTEISSYDIRKDNILNIKKDYALNDWHQKSISLPRHFKTLHGWSDLRKRVTRKTNMAGKGS